MMDILGIGTIFAGGRGLEKFEAALEGATSFAAPDEKGRICARVSLEGISDPALKKIRRADKLSKMAVLAASEAVASAGIKDVSDLGVILATAFGPHVTTFSFLDDILDYGDGGVSPTTFSNSVHNAAASYISSVLGVQGPTLTITEFGFAFHNAVALAGLWLSERRCEYVLVGVAEQYGDVLGYAAGRLAHKGYVPGEGSVFFVLGPRGDKPALARIACVGFGDEEPPQADLIMTADDSAPYGGMMTGSAFDVAAGALMLKRGAAFAMPFDGPLTSVCCLKLDCASARATISLLSA